MLQNQMFEDEDEDEDEDDDDDENDCDNATYPANRSYA
jgi:hypothetical protein